LIHHPSYVFDVTFSASDVSISVLCVYLYGYRKLYVIIRNIIIGREPREGTGWCTPRVCVIDANSVGQSVPLLVNF
jgi:hypothetical protein